MKGTGLPHLRGSLKNVKTKKGWIWVLRYRINGAEQTPLVVGLVDDFPTEDEASLEADRLGVCGSGLTVGFRKVVG